MTVKIFIRRDVSDIHARYAVFDEYENELYTVSGRNTASGEVMKVISSGFTQAKIRDLRLPVLTAYVISVKAESVKLFFTYRAGRIKARFSGISWRIRGDILSGSFDIIDADGTIVCCVYQNFLKRYIELNVFDDNRELFCIAAALCVDALNIERVPDLQMT